MILLIYLVLAMLGLHYCAGCSLVVVLRLLAVVASLMENRL